MRNKVILIFFIVIFSILYFGKDNWSHKKTWTSEDKIQKINQEFYKLELFLKPQSEELIGSDLDLQGISPKVYELLDDMILIYLFDNKEELNMGLDKAKENFHSKIYYYTLEDQVLIVYHPNDYNLESTNEVNKKIISIIKKIEINNQN